MTNNNIQFSTNNRDVIKPQEIDIFIPEHNIAIEFNGLYWHNEKSGKDKWYHYNKTKKCAEKGIRLIHIFEDEWLNNQESCMDLLGRFLGLPCTKIFARKCRIEEIRVGEARKFLEDNHLQGYSAASVTLGLFFEDKLLQLMSFKHSRYNKNIEWENIRHCNLRGHQIVGGTQKLWSYFIKTYNPTSVVSYSDNRWFEGSTYEKLGFSLQKDNPPQYFYTDLKKRWHRSLFTKKRCIKKAMEIDSELIEEELMKMTENYIAIEILELGKIWDVGQKTWVWTKK